MKIRSKLTTVVITLLCSSSATAGSPGMLFAAEAECSRWDVTGDWQFFQTNDTAPYFSLQLTQTGLTGTGSYSYWEDDCPFFVVCSEKHTVSASVDGTVNGDSFEITAYWNNGTIGVYSGKIGPQGRVQGTTYDRQHPQTIAAWYSNRTAKCAAGAGGTGETTGTTSSALETTPAPDGIRPQGRVRLPQTPQTTPSPPLAICDAARQARARNSPAAPGLERQCAEQNAVKPGGRIKLPDATTPSAPLSKCEAARIARARNSPAAPGLEAQCAAERALDVSSVAGPAEPARRTRPPESPIITKEEKFGSGGVTGIGRALQPENTIRVSVWYKKPLGYKGDTGAFGYVGPTSCDAFSLSLLVGNGAARDPFGIRSDSRMGQVGEYYSCSYLVSDIPLDQPIKVTVAVSSGDLSALWRGGGDAQPPAGQQRTIIDPTKTATLNASQPRARLTFEMVYAPVQR